MDSINNLINKNIPGENKEILNINKNIEENRNIIIDSKKNDMFPD